MSKVVFVGNVPYTMAEEQLIDVFKSVGQVVGFRLVFDRDTGKPKGYGFCEFADHETAASAVRNLNNVDVGGRSLRIDLADSDPFLEGKTTVRGEIVDGGDSKFSRDRGDKDRSHDRGNPLSFLSDLPPGLPVPPGSTALDMISQTLAMMPPTQLMEVLAQMKAFVYTHQDEARALFVHHPQFAYALFQALLLNKIVDPALLKRMLASTTGGSASTTAATPLAPLSSLPQGPPSTSGTPLPPMHHQPPSSVPGYGMPPPSAYPPLPGMPQPIQASQGTPAYGQPQQQAYPPPAAPIRPSIPGQSAPTPAPPVVNDEQQRMILQVLRMTQEEINALPAEARETIQRLRATVTASLPPLS